LADGNTQMRFLVDARMHARAGLGADDLAVAIDLRPQPLDAIESFTALGENFPAADVGNSVFGLHLRPQSLAMGTERSQRGRKRLDFSRNWGANQRKGWFFRGFGHWGAPPFHQHSANGPILRFPRQKLRSKTGLFTIELRRLRARPMGTFFFKPPP